MIVGSKGLLQIHVCCSVVSSVSLLGLLTLAKNESGYLQMGYRITLVSRY